MVRSALIVALVATCLGGCRGDDGPVGGDKAATATPEADRGQVDAAADGAPLGVVARYRRDGIYTSHLSRLDPLTLRPRRPRASVTEYHENWSYSPGGRHVALGTGGHTGDIQIFEVDGMRRTRSVILGIAAEALAWLEARRIVAILQRSQLAIVDPLDGAVVRRQDFKPGERVCFAGADSTMRTSRGLVALLFAKGGAAPRLILAGADGRIRAVTLPAEAAWGCSRAGLAMAPDQDRVFVVSREARVAEVDLATMTVEYHAVTGDIADARSRGASWLDGAGLVTYDRDPQAKGAGITVIDTQRWVARRVDRSGGAARVAAGAILAYDGSARVPDGRGDGLTAYAPDGRRRFKVLRGAHVHTVHVAGARLYAQTPKRVYALDPATGKILGRRSAIRTDISLLESSR